MSAHVTQCRRSDTRPDASVPPRVTCAYPRPSLAVVHRAEARAAPGTSVGRPHDRSRGRGEPGRGPLAQPDPRPGLAAALVPVGVHEGPPACRRPRPPRWSPRRRRTPPPPARPSPWGSVSPHGGAGHPVAPSRSVAGRISTAEPTSPREDWNRVRSSAMTSTPGRADGGPRGRTPSDPRRRAGADDRRHQGGDGQEQRDHQPRTGRHTHLHRRRDTEDAPTVLLVGSGPLDVVVAGDPVSGFPPRGRAGAPRRGRRRRRAGRSRRRPTATPPHPTP